MRLLFLDDAPSPCDLLIGTLAKFGHGVDSAPDAEEAAVMACQNDYDSIILHRCTPGDHGIRSLRKLRDEGIRTPILIISNLCGTDEVVRGLTYGADDYLAEPFVPAELSARIETLARRRYGMTDSMRSIGPLEIDTCQKTVTLDQCPVGLTAREYSLLEILSRRPGMVLSREKIEHLLYAETDSPQSNTVDATIYLLRRKLCPAGKPRLIHTRRGLGYVLELS